MILPSISLFLQTSVQMGTHILFAILGGILCEKAGHTNLGGEGMMLLGAVTGFATGLATANSLVAMLAAGLAGAGGALIYAVITVVLRGNQVVTGLVLTIFGTGVSGFCGKALSGKTLAESFQNFFKPVAIPLLSKIPVIGPMLFDHSIYVYLGMILAVVLFVYMNYTRFGLNLRATGENPAAADASGINVTAVKFVHIISGGFLCGLGGAYLSLVFVPRWQDEITAGAGWIAIALVIFCTWNPLKAMLASYAFGALRGIGFKFQKASFSLFGMEISMNSQILDMLPYIATIVVLVFISMKKKREYQAPASLGNPYFREER